MKFINLTHNRTAIVDDDRYDALMKFKWRAVRKRSSYYAKTTIYKDDKKIDISMHRFVARTPFGKVCHHINRNTLDNRSANLLNVLKSLHDELHKNDTIQIKFAPVTANSKLLSGSKSDPSQR